ncbi:hypothetical protein [Granulicella tundricola]|uniref:Uncharacterized protein n=1 Tax=Granulicella tundricola (strain ATCC BAA-1859 / DSM 23138 / MP5ACTX9) TaxID=1198114 RepID=E8WW79_GRATM|nr:hypothetical protein [Granulicella tundricola]ADW68462.1 hypothetical protein AciX9_1403 [Granulicella tundricola MP5ACTX9]
MSTSVVSFPNSASIPAVAASAQQGVPWTIWAGVLAVTSASFGGAWDVAWHRSIGRDSFLTPAHIAIYACGVIAAVVCGYLILATTFSKSQQMKDVSVQVLGFRAPLGAFIAAWGGIAMLTSAPFDNWWHNAYGLDVKIISPPHTLLILGIRAVSFGVLFLILAAMNRAESVGEETGSTHKTLQRLFLYMGGLMVVGQMFFLLEQTFDVGLHRMVPYIAMAVALPAVFALLSRTTRHPWAATIASAIYMVISIGEILIFPLVPASPKLGPVFFPVTHLIPTKFPVLIIVPAIALDLLFRRAKSWKAWQIALAAGALFTVILFAVEWPFASFLLSKASENRFFGTMYFDYNSRPDGPDRLREFIDVARGAAIPIGLAVAAVCGAVSTWIGLRFGGWMRGVQR